MHYLHIPQISTGDLLRAEAQRDTKIGREISKRLSSGLLVSDEIVNQVLGDRLRSSDCAEGFILDGYPRTLNQALGLHSQLRPKDKIVVIEIHVDLETMIRRMTSRWVCSDCRRVYSRSISPLLSHDLCDQCGATLTRRSDDREHVIRTRFRVFEQQTLPLRSYFKQLGVYNDVNGTRPREEVTLDILTLLDVEGILLNSPVARRS